MPHWLGPYMDQGVKSVDLIIVKKKTAKLGKLY